MSPKWNDKMRLLAKLSIPRIWNALLVYASFYYSRATKNSKNIAYPISLSVEPTTACNLRCPECPSGLRQFSRDTGNLKETLFKDVLNQISKKSIWLTLYFQGEPFIHPHIFKLIALAQEKKMYTTTSTNAHFLNDENAKKVVESGLDRLIVSIDGTTQEVYESYRKEGNLNKVIEGTENIIRWKKKLNSKTPYLIFQFLVVRPNEHQMDDAILLGEKLGVDEVKFKSAQVYEYKNGNPLIPINEKYSRYKRKSDGTYVIKNKLDNQCWRMWSSFVMTWDGLVVPCCFDKDATHQMGDLKERKFEEIWRGEKYAAFRSSVLRSRSEIDICKNCSEGTKVWV